MEKKHCINCMELYDGNVPRCPHCGYEQTAEPFPFGVKPETILRGAIWSAGCWVKAASASPMWAMT